MDSALSLPRYVQCLRRAVEKSTGSTVEVVAPDVTDLDSGVRLGWKRGDPHRVPWRPSYEGHFAHFMVSALYKIKRAWNEPEPQREVAQFSPYTARLREHAEQFAATAEGEDTSQFMMPLAHFACLALLRQQCRCPCDLRVERDLYWTLPEHRSKQRAFLRHRVREEASSLGDPAEAVVPVDIYRAGSAMSIAYVSEVEQLGGGLQSVGLDGHASVPVARRLLSILRAEPDRGARGDRRITDRWAAELGTRDWYQWVHPRVVGRT